MAGGRRRCIPTCMHVVARGQHHVLSFYHCPLYVLIQSLSLEPRMSANLASQLVLGTPVTTSQALGIYMLATNPK